MVAPTPLRVTRRSLKTQTRYLVVVEAVQTQALDTKCLAAVAAVVRTRVLDIKCSAATPLLDTKCLALLPLLGASLIAQAEVRP